MKRMSAPFMTKRLAFATGAIFLATLLAYTGRWFWPGEVLVNFRVHFAGLLFLALAVALALRQWRIAVIAVVGLVLNVWPMYGAFFGVGPSKPSDARAVRVVSFNVHIGNGDLPGIAAYLDSLDADVVVLAESSPVSRVEELAALLPELPHRYLAERDGIRGVAILSRWPLIAPRPAIDGALPFAARADVDLGDRTFRLYGAHLSWPVLPATARRRNAQLAALGRNLAACRHACAAVGDFNVTPWSSRFRDVVKPTAVHDCAAGRGLLTTWPSGLPAFMRIRIDQCLIAGAISVNEVRVGGSVGSDHFATINDLWVGGPASPGISVPGTVFTRER
jgi:endonuclease/exonuclease/phosphatase (EEP) superfamily protein YafD